MQLPDGDVLIFDLECRPTAWIGGDFVGRSLTAYAYTYLHSDEVVADAILPGDQERFALMVISIASAVETADVNVGHYIKGFDLPLLNADLERIHQVTLPRMVVVDTKIDRITGLGISESLENLAARYELNVQKMDMREPYWEEFNLWQTPKSRQRVLDRVTSDILATKELYLALEAEGRLKSPSIWDPTKAKMPRYRA